MTKIEKINNEKNEELEINLEEIAPNFRKKNSMTESQIEKIINTISQSQVIPQKHVKIGMKLLFLQGAASAGAPITMSVDLAEGKTLEKRNIIDACNMVCSHKFIRRIAEAQALEIGEFAHHHKLTGELGYRINNKLKAETGESLNEKEMAFCSSFSQSIPNLAEITSERLAKLLAEDYQRRFEGKKKPKTESIQNNQKGNKSKKAK